MAGHVYDPDTGEAFPFYNRADIGLRPPKARVPFSQARTHKIRHHLAARGPDPRGLLRGAQSYHMDAQGWLDIAYQAGWHDAGIFELRGFDVVGGATYGHNSHTLATVYVGHGDDEPTARAYRALRCLEKLIDAHCPEPTMLERLHSDYASTACPGGRITRWHHAGSPVTGGPTQPPPPPPPQGGRCRWRYQGSTPRLLHLTYANLPGSWMRGRDVAEIQFILNVLNGMDPRLVVAVDGEFGPATSGAVVRFQRVWNFYRPDIKPDGVVGPKTRAAICEVLTLKGVWT